jgi:hypothetical protein
LTLSTEFGGFEYPMNRVYNTFSIGIKRLVVQQGSIAPCQTLESAWQLNGFRHGRAVDEDGDNGNAALQGRPNLERHVVAGLI